MVHVHVDSTQPWISAHKHFPLQTYMYIHCVHVHVNPFQQKFYQSFTCMSQIVAPRSSNSGNMQLHHMYMYMHCLYAMVPAVLQSLQWQFWSSEQ